MSRHLLNLINCGSAMHQFVIIISENLTA